MSRPALPRASSAMSGFFFCGMIDEPVAKASSSSTQPNSVRGPEHDLLAEPGQVHADQRGDEAGTRRRSRGRDTASIELARGAGRSRAPWRRATGSSGSDEPASAPEPSGETAARASQSRSRSRSRSERLHVGEQLVARTSTGWACCRWVMPGAGVSRCRAGLLDQRVGQRRPARAASAAGVVAQVEPQVGGDLVVAGPAGAQLAAERAELLQQAALERGVHVLVLDRRAEVAVGARRLAARRARPSIRPSSSSVEQAGPVQDPGVRPGAGEVVGRQPPVELHADGQPGQRLGGAAGEPAAPQPGALPPGGVGSVLQLSSSRCRSCARRRSAREGAERVGRRAAVRRAGDEQDECRRRRWCPATSGRPAWSSAEARNWAPPGGVRTTTRLRGGLGRDEQVLEQPGQPGSARPRCRRAAAPSGGSGVGRAAVGGAHLDRAELLEVAATAWPG